MFLTVENFQKSIPLGIKSTFALLELPICGKLKLEASVK